MTALRQNLITDLAIKSETKLDYQLDYLLQIISLINSRVAIKFCLMSKSHLIMQQYCRITIKKTTQKQ